MSSQRLTDAGVRPARPSDLPAARRVLLAAYREYAATLPPAVFGRYLTDILDVESRAGSGEVLVAEHGGRVVGTVTYYPDAADEGFGWPPAGPGCERWGRAAGRGLGIGRALLEACLERGPGRRGAGALPAHGEF